MYNTPEGYFENLQKRLETIPSRHQAPVQTTVVRLRPVLASVAAGLAIALVAGVALLRNNAPVYQDSLSYEDYFLADMLPVTNPYFYVEEDEYDESDDALEWFINSRVPTDYIEYMNESE